LHARYLKRTHAAFGQQVLGHALGVFFDRILTAAHARVDRELQHLVLSPPASQRTRTATRSARPRFSRHWLQFGRGGASCGSGGGVAGFSLSPKARTRLCAAVSAATNNVTESSPLRASTRSAPAIARRSSIERLPSFSFAPIFHAIRSTNGRNGSSTSSASARLNGLLAPWWPMPSAGTRPAATSARATPARTTA